MSYPKVPTRSGLGKFLRSRRKRAGRTMGDVAHASGLALVVVSAIERGLSGDAVAMRRFVDAVEQDPRIHAFVMAHVELVVLRAAEQGET